MHQQIVMHTFVRLHNPNQRHSGSNVITTICYTILWGIKEWDILIYVPLYELLCNSWVVLMCTYC